MAHQSRSRHNGRDVTMRNQITMEKMDWRRTWKSGWNWVWYRILC